MSAPADQQRRRQQATSSQGDSSRRRAAETPSSNSAPRRQAAPTSGPAPTSSSGRPAPTSSAPAPRPAANRYGDDGPAPPEAPIDDYDRAQDTRDDEVARHWAQWYQRIEEDYTYPVVIDQDLAPDLFRVLGSEPPLFNATRKPRLGEGDGGTNTGTVRVALLDGENLDLIKDSFRGKKGTVIIQNHERSAFVPTRLKSSAVADLKNAPPPVPAPPIAQLPIRGPAPTPSSSSPASQPAPRREERRRDEGNGERRGNQGNSGRGGNQAS
jgi:hypothetical protein